MEILDIVPRPQRRLLDCRGEPHRAQQAEPPRSDMQIQRDQRRIRELEARVMELEREREILKKSTAFFVKEMDRSSK